MARQRIHNRRASRGAQGGQSWISYSDMMAALLLIFVLILTYSLYHYFSMLETKTNELNNAIALNVSYPNHFYPASLSRWSIVSVLNRQRYVLPSHPRPTLWDLKRNVV